MPLAHDLPRGNALIGQSGGPTAVINQSLVGIIEGLRDSLVASGHVGKILGMRHAVRGLVKTPPDVIDLTGLSHERLERLAATPSAGLGSTRDKPDTAYCEKVLAACRTLDVRYFFYIGGNDSSDTCRIVREMAERTGYDLRCFHAPKTVDNDLMENDHTPGFPSAARFVAMATMADALDNAALPGIKVNIIMGRHAGFLTAASVLARRPEKFGGEPWERDGPHLVYVPEVAFDVDRFVGEVESVYAWIGRCQVSVSEGVSDAAEVPIGASLIKGGETDAHGNVQLSGSGALGDSLADLLKARLTPKGGKPPRVRADTFGYLQRCWPDASPVDQREARESGRFAAGLAASGERDGSVALVRTGNSSAYRCGYKRVELGAVAGKTRKMPGEFVEGGSGVTRQFVGYCLPLVGTLPRAERL